jgi:hypothetical protein
MKPKVYVETTIISYLAALPSRDIVLAAHQELTREWWGTRSRFELFVSQAVVDEAARGDAAGLRGDWSCWRGFLCLPLEARPTSSRIGCSGEISFLVKRPSTPSTSLSRL